MLRRTRLLLTFFLLAAAWGNATPLRLDYTKSWSANGIVYYTFTLALENADQSWVPGQGFGWLIFGDSPSLGGSPFNDFTLDGGILGIGPWNTITTSSGSHNGPTLGPVTDFWIPNNVGDFLTWHGYSTSNVADGALFFSTFFTQDGAVGADMVLANNLFPDASFPDSPAFVPAVNTPPSSGQPSSSSSSSSSSTSSGGTPPNEELFIQTAALAEVPEPGSIGLAGLALLAIAWNRQRTNRR